MKKKINMFDIKILNDQGDSIATVHNEEYEIFLRWAVILHDTVKETKRSNVSETFHEFLEYLHSQIGVNQQV